LDLLNLEKLDLSKNFISDIDIFGKLEAPKLLYIYLEKNLIKNPSIFLISKFNNVDILDLRKNNIDESTSDHFKRRYKLLNKRKNCYLFL
jgi:Leucine-rich repeat (LRR) protein